MNVLDRLYTSTQLQRLLSVCIVAGTTWRYFVQAFAARGHSLIIDWADTPTLTRHMREDPWSRWWLGQWVGGTNFYRPITSTLWGVMYRATGMNGLMQFDLMQALSQVVAAVLVWLFVAELLGSWIGFLTIAFFCFSAAEALGLPNIHYGLQTWIDTPEQWLLIGIVASAWAFLKAARTGSRPAYAVSIAFLVLTIGVKESGYVVPAILLWVLWVDGKLKQWRLTVPHFLTTAALALFRLVLFHGHGMTYGSNREWLVRFVTNAFGGQPLVELTQGCADGVMVLALLLSVLFFVQAVFERSGRFAIAATASVAAFFWLLAIDSRLLGIDMFVGAARFLTPDKGTTAPPILVTSVPTLIVFGIWANVFLHPSIRKWQAVVLIVILYAPLLITASWLHVLYSCAMGWALLLGLIAADLATTRANASANVRRGSVATPH